MTHSNILRSLGISAPLLVVLSLTSFQAAFADASKSPEACQVLLGSEAPMVTDAEMKFLLNLKNGYAAMMVKVWAESSETNLTSKSFLDESSANIAKRYLNADGTRRLEARRLTQPKVQTDGVMLGQIYLGRMRSQRSLERLAELWKEASLSLAPELKGKLNAKAITAMSALLQEGHQPQAEPEVEVPLQEVPRSRTSVTHLGMRELAQELSQLTELSYYKDGNLESIFAYMISKIVSPYEMTKLLPRIEAIGFKNSDAKNGVNGSAARHRILEGMRLVAKVLESKQSNQPPADIWLYRVTEDYKARLQELQRGRMKVAPSEPKPEPVVVAEPTAQIIEFQAPQLYVPAPAEMVGAQLTEPMPQSTVVKVVGEIPGFKSMVKSKDFLQFVKENAYYSMFNPNYPGSRELVYSEDSRSEPVFVIFKAMLNKDSGVIEIQISNVEKTNSDEESRHYSDLARHFGIQSQEYFLTGNRVLSLGNDVTSSLKVPAKVYLRARMKHRISDDELSRVLRNIREVEPSKDSFAASETVGNRRFRVYVRRLVSGEVIVRDIYEKLP